MCLGAQASSPCWPVTEQNTCPLTSRNEEYWMSKQVAEEAGILSFRGGILGLCEFGESLSTLRSSLQAATLFLSFNQMYPVTLPLGSAHTDTKDNLSFCFLSHFDAWSLCLKSILTLIILTSVKLSSSLQFSTSWVTTGTKTDVTKPAQVGHFGLALAGSTPHNFLKKFLPRGAFEKEEELQGKCASWLVSAGICTTHPSKPMKLQLFQPSQNPSDIKSKTDQVKPSFMFLYEWFRSCTTSSSVTTQEVLALCVSVSEERKCCGTHKDNQCVCTVGAVVCAHKRHEC